ncbi:MAG TPA: hypothetical protein DIC30_02355 [Oceanospirillales bacterium]|nr:hypothetical protein [Oceanospirillales bacterium]|tara:strand:+ start:5496 stop:5810 length:315 start_codon:yes stop_codon:yes gene_type:complete
MEIIKVSAIFDELELECVQIALRGFAATNFSTHPTEIMRRNIRDTKRCLVIKDKDIEIYIAAEYAKDVAGLIESVISVNQFDKAPVSIESIEGLFGCPKKQEFP